MRSTRNPITPLTVFVATAYGPERFIRGLPDRFEAEVHDTLKGPVTRNRSA